MKKNRKLTSKKAPPTKTKLAARAKSAKKTDTYAVSGGFPVYIASDHAGFELKQKLIERLPENFSKWFSLPANSVVSLIELKDLGPADAQRVDYPDYAKRAIEAWQKPFSKKSIHQLQKLPQLSALLQRFERGVVVLICGSGMGMSIAANRNPRVRAGLVFVPEIAQLAREHNDINTICLGSRFVSEAAALEIIRQFLLTDFAEGRHSQRVRKLGRMITR